jgi:hypothetical protein
MQSTLQSCKAMTFVAIVFVTTSFVCLKATTEPADALAAPTAQEMIAAAGGEHEAGMLLGVALREIAFRQLLRSSESDHLFSLLNTQWRKEWVPTDGVYKDDRHVMFTQVSRELALGRYQQGGRVLLIQLASVTSDKLELIAVDQGPCSAAGVRLVFQRANRQWQRQGLAESFEKTQPNCG